MIIMREGFQTFWAHYPAQQACVCVHVCVCGDHYVMVVGQAAGLFDKSIWDFERI